MKFKGFQTVCFGEEEYNGSIGDAHRALVPHKDRFFNKITRVEIEEPLELHDSSAGIKYRMYQAARTIYYFATEGKSDLGAKRNILDNLHKVVGMNVRRG